MRNSLALIIFLSLSINSYSQIEKHSTQVGVTALPVFDVFNYYPDSKIAGFAVLPNFGYFPAKNLSIGINPFYGNVSNKYEMRYGNGLNQPQEVHVDRISLYGLNAYLRYYFIAKEKVALYELTSLGIGNLQTKTFDDRTKVQVDNKSNAVFNLMAGLGANYYISKKVALELNIPFLYLKYLTPVSTNYYGIAPSIGVQFYFLSDANSLAK